MHDETRSLRTEIPGTEPENSLEEVRTAQEMTQTIRETAAKLEETYPGLGIEAIMKAAVREVEERITKSITERNVGRRQDLDLRNLHQQSLEKHPNLLSIQQALEYFSKKEKSFGEGEQTISAQDLQTILLEASQVCDGSQEAFEQAVAKIPKTLPFANNIVETLHRCRNEILQLQKPNIIVDDILNSLNNLSQLGWEFPMQAGKEVLRLADVKERIRRIQNDKFGNPQVLMDEIEELPDYLHLRAKVLVDIRSGWDWVKRRLHPTRPSLNEAVKRLDDSKTDSNRFASV